MSVVAMIVGILVGLVTATASYGMFGFNFVETLMIYFATGTLTMVLTFMRLRMSFGHATNTSVFK